ncbi:MAG: hypothetical protein FD126_1738 [Elusimicrobia bacterium]|nr:MAG: hypothetical protein FD126_1738 [Elusimicrobiota bacterium]
MTLGLLLAAALTASAQTSWPDGVPQIPEGVVVEPELHCRPEVIEAMKKAWDVVGRGREEYEAAFRIDRSEAGEYSVKFATMTFETLRLTLDIDRARTVAIVHTHPDISVHHPADKDFAVPVPNYVVSGRGLTVTVPGTKRWKTLRRRWDRPCE